MSSSRLAVTSITQPSRRTVLLVYLGAIIAGLAAGAVLLLIDGHNPIRVYTEMVKAAFGSRDDIAATLAQATPLILTGAAFAVPMKMQLYNIGGEGQLLMGAVAASGVAIAFDGLSGWIVIPLVLIGGMLGGAVIAGLSGAAKARFGASEIVTTLMMNFVVINFVNYLIFSSNTMWRDKESTNFPKGKQIPSAAHLPEISGQLTIGLIVAIGVVAALALAVRHTSWGFRLRMLGDSPNAARYAGVGVFGLTVSVLAISGALAGLSGAMLVAGPVGALEPRSLTIGLGYVGILVAALARANLLVVIPVAIGIAAIQASRLTLQGLDVPSSMITMLQGVILITVGLGQFFLYKRITIIRPVSAVESAGPVAEPAIRLELEESAT